MHSVFSGFRAWLGPKLYLISLLTINVLASACEDLVELDYPQTDSTIVIDAQLQAGKSLELRLLYTQAFDAQGYGSPVTDAQVLLLNLSTHHSEQVPHIGNGIYQGTQLQGVAAQVYQLQIQHHQKTYSATDTLFAVPELQKVQIGFVRSTDANRSILIDFTDPPGANYYRWLVRVDDYTLYQAHDLLLSDDRLFNNHSLHDFVIYDGRFLERMRPGSRVTIWQISLSQAAYRFYYQLYLQSGTNPNPWAQPAYNLQGNFSGGALGLFRAISVCSHPEQIVE